MNFKEGIKRVAYCVGTAANYASLPIGGWLICDAMKYSKEYSHPVAAGMCGAVIVYSGIAGLARRKRDIEKTAKINKLESEIDDCINFITANNSNKKVPRKKTKQL